MPWQPILTGRLGLQAQDAIRNIATFLANSEPRDPGPTLAAGNAGIALFYGYLAAASKEPGADDLAVQRLCSAVDSAPSLNRIGLFTGLCGIAWSLRHLSQLLPGQVDEKATAEVDQLIQEVVSAQPWPWNYDLIYGLSGLGCYALDHHDVGWSGEVWRQIVRRFDELVTDTPAGRTWWTSPTHLDAQVSKRFPDGYCNLGVAHGIAGVIGVLARRQAEWPDRAGKRLLSDAVSWFLEQARSSKEGSVYPPFFTASAADGRSARSGWCYGDPGVAITLLCAARVLGEGRLERRAIDLALRDAQRSYDSSGVVDAPLCHGAAGLGHLYNRLYQATGEQSLAQIARCWFERALRLQQPAPGADGFPSWWPQQRRWRTEPGLLDGAAGVGLALIAAVSSLEPRWDRALLLDLPSP